MSSEIYELMKRSDEAHVVEKAHRNPRFVEDVVREMIRRVADAYPEPRRGRLRPRPPGEPGDDPSPLGGRRALRPASPRSSPSSRPASTRATTPPGASGSRPPAPEPLAAGDRLGRGRRRALLVLGHPLAQAEEVVERPRSRSPRPRGRAARRPRSGAGSNAIRAKIAATWSAVFSFPSQLAAITTPRSAATLRSPVTASSRAMITIAIQAARRSSETSEISAAITSSLSASGSISLPKLVTCLRRRAM